MLSRLGGITVYSPWRGSAKRFSTAGFFHESVSSKPLSIPLGPFPIFQKKLQRYSQLKVHHRCHWHQCSMEKHLNQNGFNFFTPFDSRVNIQIFFSFKFTLRCQQSVVVPIICHQYQQHQRYRWQNLLLVSLIPTLTNEYIRITAISFERNQNDPNDIFRALLEEDSCKKPEAKNIVTLAL